MIKGYFVDIDGHIFTLATWFEGGCDSSFPVHVEGDSVYEVVRLEKDGGKLLGECYTLHTTLTDLATAIEDKL